MAPLPSPPRHTLSSSSPPQRLPHPTSGLPHAHIIVTLHLNDKLVCPEAIDKYISAEIPSSENLILQKLVIKHMLHGPHKDKSACYDKK